MSDVSSQTRGPVARPGIADIHPYVPGDGATKDGGRGIKLASNESALGASPRALAAYQAAGQDLHLYPEGGAIDLREALASHHGIPSAHIVCSNGSDELIGMLVRGYVGEHDTVVHSRHGFLMYPLATRIAGATPIAAPERQLTADVDALLAAVTKRTRIVFLANPNNPTGTYLPRHALERLHANLSEDVLLAIDAAYAEYVVNDDYTDAHSLVATARNVVVLHTFSKIYGLAGLRLGWAYCDPDVANVLNRVRGAFNVNRAAQAAGVAALADQAWIGAAREHNLRWRPWLAAELEKLGLMVTPSVANFLLVHFRDADAAHRCLVQAGISTRKMGAYGLPQSLRISIGTEAEVRAVVDTLRVSGLS